MTYREKVQEEHPECIDSNELGGVRDCPADYDYEDGIYCHKVGDDCGACWDREIPGTEPTNEPMRDYKVGDKFVIEIKEIVQSKGEIILDEMIATKEFVDKLQVLDSDYVNEYFGELQDEAYNKGFDDTWELIKKIHEMRYGDVLEIFPCINGMAGDTAMNVIYTHTPQEVRTKLEAHEKEQAEIKKGNVIYSKTYNRELIVTCIDTEHKGVYGINSEGHTQWEDFSNLTKTDKHVDIENVLNQIAGVNNEANNK